LRYHLNAVSTFKVGRLWILLVSVLVPVVLGYMLISRIWTLTVEGYADLPGWYLVSIGWGAIFAIIAGAALLTALRWRFDPDRFDVWPPYPPPAASAGSAPTSATAPANPHGPSTDGGAS
jgi:NSS family neurotransmitter:Na+ symporter